MEDTARPAPQDGRQNLIPAADDESLLDAVRNHDRQAYGELYRRHCGAVFAVARLHTNSHAEAEDITSEAFTRVLALLRSGGGPRQFLRAYLITAVSRLAADRANDLDRAQPQEPREQGKLDRVQLFDDIVVRQVDAAVVARAFASLPERWQEVLWYLEIEGYRPRQVASVVGIQPNAVSALAKRAREGLRTAYMQQHVSAQALEECGEYSAQLGAFVRGTLTPSKMRLMRDHLDSCERCTAEYLQLQDLGVGLRGWILPVLAGLPLWGDASDRLIAALGAVGAGSAAGVSGVMSATTTPPGACAPGAPVPAAATATATSTASVSAVTAAVGGVITSSATKVILAAAVVVVAGTGAAGIVATIHQDSSKVTNTRQVQPAMDGLAGSSVGSASDPPGAGARDKDDDSTGSLPSPTPDPTPAKDDPSGARPPTARENSTTPQLEVPLLPALPGPVPLSESPVAEAAGPPEGPAEESSDDGGGGEASEGPRPVGTTDDVVAPLPEVAGPAGTPDPALPEVPGSGGVGTEDRGPADPNGPVKNDNGSDTPGNPDTPDPPATPCDPGARPSTPEVEVPVTPGAPSSPEEPQLAGPGTQPTTSAVDPTVPLPTGPVTEPMQPVPDPTDAVDDANVTVPEDPSGATGQWGTVPCGWTLSDWIAYLLTGVCP